jgi:hypothetical protein
VDINKLYFDHQVALMRAACAPIGALRTAFCARAADLARDIFRLHDGAGATARADWGPASWDRRLCLDVNAGALPS